TGWLIADKLVKAAGELTIGLWMARYLGPENFGLLSYAIAFVGLFGAIAPVGLNKIVVRDLVREPQYKYEILGTALVIRVLSGVVLAAIASLSILKLRPDEPQVHWLIVMIALGIVLQAADIIGYWFQTQMQAHNNAIAASTAYLISSGLRIGSMLKQLPVMAFGALMGIEIAVRSAGLALAYFRSGEAIHRWQCNLKRASCLLRASLPLVLSGIAVTIYMRIDQIMLGQMAGDEAVGIYAAAVKLSEAWYFIPVAIARSSFPLLLAAKQDNEDLYYRRLRKLFKSTVAITYIIILPTALFARPLISSLLGQAYLPAGSILSVHIWSGLFVSLGVIRELWMTAENLLQFYFITTASGALINIGINYALIPDYGSVGAAVATLVSYAFANLILCSIYPKTRVIAKIMVSTLVPIPMKVRLNHD
ncbi:MAG: flippase, partial [Cyanobacteria bacterium P01_C01_bin.72]